MSNDNKACAVSIVILISVFFGYAIVSEVNYRDEAIANNCAGYNSINGEFEWRISE